jgi:TPR repeat protein
VRSQVSKSIYLLRPGSQNGNPGQRGTIMSRGRILEVVLTILGAVLLLIAAGRKHPYGFYMVLRLVITVGAVYWAWRVYKAGQRAWTWMFVAVALLLNPFLPIRMQRTQWQPIDLCLGILLFGWSGYWLFRKRTRESEIKSLAEQKAMEISAAYQVLSDPQKRCLYDQQLDAHQQTQTPQRQTPTSSQDGQAYQWPGTGAYQKAGSFRSGPSATVGTRAAGPMRTSSTRGWWTDLKLYAIAWAAVCLLLGVGFFLTDFPLGFFWFMGVGWFVLLLGVGAWQTDSTPYRITWTAVYLLLGGGFSLAVSSPFSGLGLIFVFALAFGGFACAAMLWSRVISRVLVKIGITTFAMQVIATGCVIVCAILNLNFVGSLAARSSTPETQLGNSVSGTSTPPVQNQNNASDASKKAAANGVWGASAGCHPPVLTQQELSALKWQATNGNAEAQCILGVLYYHGQGLPKDDTQAALWSRKAAEQGLAHAQYDVGNLYYEDVSHGLPQDDIQTAFWRRKIRAWRAYINSVDFHNSEHWRHTQAAFWYRKAAEQGDADAQNSLGYLYSEGQGVPQDYAQAALWYRKAAEQGDAVAQTNLGNLYYDGQGVLRDYAQAALWYRKAAEQGDADAQDSLGDLYDTGRGVPRDYAEAYFWYDLAAAGEKDTPDEQDASDSKPFAKDRDEAASHLTPADLFREQGRAGKWFEEHHQAKPQ